VASEEEWEWGDQRRKVDVDRERKGRRFEESR
jgi:hypothetical protein